MTMTMTNDIQLQEIDAQTLNQWLEANTVTLIDVREPAEYATERIPGAQLRPLSQFDPHQLRPAAGQKLVLYCQSGKRSTKAAQHCLEAGFRSVSQLRGGLSTWKQAGYAIEKSENG
jgi:rhodanese-related sulfurtransferase